MNVVAVGYGFKKIHYEIIQSISENVLYRPIQIMDLRSFEPTFSGTDAVICFGSRARKCFDKNNQGCIHFIELSQIQNLEDKEGNEKEKEKAWKALLTFKEKLDNTKTITDKDLPDMKAGDVLSLEAQLKEKNITEWFGTTKDGRTVYLSSGAGKERKADINLSFAELYALKTAMEVLDIEEVVIK